MSRRRAGDLGPTCKVCGKVPPKTPDITWMQWEWMSYCETGQCFPTAELKRRRVLEDLAWIAGTDTWDSIATRLGFASRYSLERYLDRVGAHDWAARTRPDRAALYRQERAA